MRINIFYMLLSMIILPFLSIGQTFQKEYFNDDYARYTLLLDARLRADGSIIGSVYNQFYDNYNFGAGFACFQPDGTPNWVIGDPDKHLFFGGSTVLLPDGGFITTGNWQFNTAQNGQSVVLRFDANGNLVWSRQLPLLSNKTYASLGVYGKTSIFLVGNASNAIYLSSINAGGSANWERELRIDSTFGTAVAELENGNLLIGLVPIGQMERRVRLIEVNSAGDFVQGTSYKTGNIGSILGLKNGNILMSSSPDWNENTRNILISMLDPQLKPVWSKKIEIPGWAIDGCLLVPNLQQDSLTVLFNNSFDSELGMLTLGLDGALHTAKTRFGTIVLNAQRMPDDGLLLAGGKSYEYYARSVLVRTDANMNVEGCPAVPLCNLGYSPEMLTFAPESFTLNTTNSIQPIQLTVQKTNWQSKDYCADPPAVDASFITFDSTVCAGTKVDFFALSGGNGTWQFETGQPAYQNSGWVGTAQFDVPGQFLVTHITTQAGCYRDTATQTIQVFSKPSLALPTDHIICAGDSVLVEPEITESGVLYKWSDGIATPQRTLNKSGTYILEAINIEGCKNSDTTTLHTVPLPEVQIDGQTAACVGETIVLQAATDRSGLEILWSTGLENAALAVQISGLYSVAVNDGPCTAEDTMTVFFKECPTCTLFVPNVFAPGSGGANDQWAVQSNCAFVQYHLQIFDRWGNLVFQSSAPNASWAGVYRGKILPPGVYVCRIDLETDNGDKRSRVQRLEHVTIVR